MKSIRRIVFSVLAAAAMCLSLTTAASAHPEVTYIGCESGGSRFICDVEYTHATEPVTIRWEGYTGGYHIFTDYGSRISRGCTVGKYYSFQVFLTDAAGTTQTSTGVTCRSVWQ